MEVDELLACTVCASRLTQVEEVRVALNMGGLRDVPTGAAHLVSILRAP